jgi:hypothetical protein
MPLNEDNSTNPVLRPGPPGTWDAGALGSMSVVRVGEQLHMYYEAWAVWGDRWLMVYDPTGYFDQAGGTIRGATYKGEREPAYQNRLVVQSPARNYRAPSQVPNHYEFQDAVRLASQSIWARLDLQRAPLTTGTPVAAELWSWLPNEGRVVVVAHRALPRLALRLPEGALRAGTCCRRGEDAVESKIG